jgi:hypothetical protein
MITPKNCLNCFACVTTSNHLVDEKVELRCMHDGCKYYETIVTPDFKCSMCEPINEYDVRPGGMRSADIAKERLEAGYGVIFYERGKP